PLVKQPKRTGFGTRMIERALAAELEADVNLGFPSTGLECKVKCASSSILGDDSEISSELIGRKSASMKAGQKPGGIPSTLSPYRSSARPDGWSPTKAVRILPMCCASTTQRAVMMKHCR